MADINDIADRNFDFLKRMGWVNTNPLEDLAMVCSEIGEAVNECRGEELGENFGTELADIILRTLGIAKKNGIDISLVIEAKMLVNEQRGTRGRIK